MFRAQRSGGSLHCFGAEGDHYQRLPVSHRDCNLRIFPYNNGRVHDDGLTWLYGRVFQLGHIGEALFEEPLGSKCVNGEAMQTSESR